jgi:hypothetical protein
MLLQCYKEMLFSNLYLPKECVAAVAEFEAELIIFMFWAEPWLVEPVLHQLYPLLRYRTLKQSNTGKARLLTTILHYYNFHVTSTGSVIVTIGNIASIQSCQQ